MSVLDFNRCRIFVMLRSCWCCCCCDWFSTLSNEFCLSTFCLLSDRDRRVPVVVSLLVTVACCGSVILMISILRQCTCPEMSTLCVLQNFYDLIYLLCHQANQKYAANILLFYRTDDYAISLDQNFNNNTTNQNHQHLFASVFGCSCLRFLFD